MAIHPTAIVEAGARLDPSCEVGPFAWIGPHVRMGPGCSVAPHGIVTGRTTLGARNNSNKFHMRMARKADTFPKEFFCALLFFLSVPFNPYFITFLVLLMRPTQP